MDIQIYNMVNNGWLGCQKSEERVPNKGEFIELDKQVYEVYSVTTIFNAAKVQGYTQYALQVKKLKQ